MKQHILEALRHLEVQHNIRILYAVESGSRAWGFASTDSDWDVRFIYIHRPEWYVSIDEQKDSITQMLPQDLDVSGWEIRKALRLFRKSNPPLLEWMRSPLVYLEQGDFTSKLRLLEQQYFNPKSCLYHYFQMAKGNFREYLKDDFVKTKKYFYVLRPVLACQWIEQNNSVPPMEFQTLLDSQIEDTALKVSIEELLVRKRSGIELGIEPKIQGINDFLEAQIQHFEEYISHFNHIVQPETAQLNQLFRDTLNEWK